jgi:SAM-dependent methyltransferase
MIRFDGFRGTAAYYTRWRPGYPDAVFDLLVRRFHLDGRGRLLDLGTGSGQLALPLAPHFEEIVGLDPEPEMLEQAAASARQRGITNVTWIQGGSGEVGPRLGAFRLVTIGRAFHWMDRDDVLRRLHPQVHPGGGLAVVDDDALLDGSSEWQRRIQAIIQQWLGPTRRAGSSVYVPPPELHDVPIRRSAFRSVETHTLTAEREWTLDGIVGYLYSTSFCSPAVLGEKREPFERHLRETLAPCFAAGPLVQAFTIDVCLAWRD